MEKGGRWMSLRASAAGKERCRREGAPPLEKSAPPSGGSAADGEGRAAVGRDRRRWRRAAPVGKSAPEPGARAVGGGCSED